MNMIARPLDADTEHPAFDVERIRAQFPILQQQVHGKPLVFLDSAASAMKPDVVIDAMADTMRTQYANVHRGLHWMSERTTDAYEGTRDAVARLLNAPSRDGDRVCEEHDGSDQPARPLLRRADAAGSGGVDFRDGAPRQHRALADAAGTARASNCASPA